MDQPTDPSSPQPRPFPAYPQPPQNPAAVGLPIINGYQLVQPLSTTDDGALWLAGHVESGGMVGIGFMNRMAVTDPASVLRMKQELALHLPDNKPQLLVVNPPLDAAAAVARTRPRTTGGGSGVPVGVFAAILGCGGLAVVAIIALLATIAVPSFLRARKRSQATQVMNDARIYEAAVDQWAIENSRDLTDTYSFSEVSDYIRASAQLISTSGSDIMGNAYTTGAVSEGVKVHPYTYDQFSDVTRDEFWGSYAPGYTP